MRAVQADPRLTTSDSLPEPLLKDHVPKLVEAFIQFIRSGAASAAHAAKSNADTHGEERWLQGYSIREVLLEIYWLRTILFRKASEFARGLSDEAAICAAVCGLMDGFLNDLESRSVASFSERSESALKKANSARLRLIRSVSHELRNMLNSVGLAASALEVRDQESIQRMLQNLDVNSQHMKEVLDDLLNLSQNSPEQAVIKGAVFAPSSLLTIIDSAYRPKAESKGLHFSSSVKEGLDEVCTDQTKVRQIMEILVSNAIAYTREGNVSVRIELVNGNCFAIIVQDTGLGIAKEDREDIFSEYYHVTPESPLRGSGLGLALLASLVEVLNGSMELKSEPGEGSIFRVTLPRVHRQ